MTLGHATTQLAMRSACVCLWAGWLPVSCPSGTNTHVHESQRAVNTLELAEALLENGDALISDAEYLWEGGRGPRAAALALMATEEFSKLYLCLDAITGDAPIPRATSMEWRGHRDKLETARALELAFFDPEPDFDMAKAKADVAYLLRLKMACIYVDHELGAIKRPEDVHEDVPALLAGARAKSSLLHSVFDPITQEHLEAMDEHRELLADLVEALVDEEDPGSTVWRLRSLAAAAVLNDPDALQVALTSALRDMRSPSTQEETSAGRLRGR